jgi:DNA-binding winged helix-turn-helix (wHTH) protein
MVSRFGCFEMDPERRQLTASGRTLHLTPKAFDLLWLLVEAAPRVVPKSEIHERLWRGGVVSDATLVSLIKEIRRAMQDQSAQPPLRTVHRVGYALDLPVVRLKPVSSAHGHCLITGRRRFDLVAGENVIGRDSAATIWLDKTTLSRRHARITLVDGNAVLEDLGSKNGTVLRGLAVREPMPLRAGDEFTCGQVQFRYLDTAAHAMTETMVHPPLEAD